MTAEALLAAIHDTCRHRWTLMEVCGGQSAGLGRQQGGVVQHAIGGTEGRQQQFVDQLLREASAAAVAKLDRGVVGEGHPW